MKHPNEASFLPRHRSHTAASRARFETRVNHLGKLVRPLVVEAMSSARWPEWFALQMRHHGPTLMDEEVDSLARQVLTYREQMDWLLPDVDQAASNRHAAEHVACARGYWDNEALWLKLEEGLGETVAMATVV